MNPEQNLNKISLNELLKISEKMLFSIQADPGNVYVLGQRYDFDHYRILYCQSNYGAEVVADGVTYSLTRGDILVIKPHTPHGFVTYGHNGEPYVGYVVTVGEEYLNQLVRLADQRDAELVRQNVLIHTRGTLWERIDGLFLMSLEEQELKAPGWEMAMMGSSIILLIQIARVASINPSIVTKIEKQELLTGIISYVEANLGEKITLEDVANRFFVSASTVTHLFSKKVNISFYKYVMQRRLWQAKNLIKEGMPMEKIAVKVGFNDYSAFYRAFKQEFHMSPRQFYKEISEKKAVSDS